MDDLVTDLCATALESVRLFKRVSRAKVLDPADVALVFANNAALQAISARLLTTPGANTRREQLRLAAIDDQLDAAVSEVTQRWQ